MRLEQANQELKWPLPKDIITPSGSGPAVYAQKATAKIAKPLGQKYPDVSFRLGVVHRDPHGDSSEAPLAIACDFETTASSGMLRELHRLSWNFCHAPVLVVFEPGQIRVWDCETKPIHAQSNEDSDAAGPPEPLLATTTGVSMQEAKALRLLNWISIVTGAFFKEVFPPDKSRGAGRADRSLLDNLKDVRYRLRKLRLSSDTCHDLLARIIFVQFLFDRKDSQGVSALNPNILKRWHADGSLKQTHENLESILLSKSDTYRLFKKLDTLFNGDLFPGKDPDCKISIEQAWANEMAQVGQEHLDLLASLVSGKADTRTGQFWLWREYAFDTIPLEFISSIYEEFVVRDEEDEKAAAKGKTPVKSKKGVVFTPGLLADFVLDQVLPWKGKQWDLSVFDPSCGSGIFLVKSFQRLVHRWRQAHPKQRPTPSVLRQILERNIVGVDINPHAVRVASFSLYLAMMDELNPRDYLKRNQIRLPSLRKRRILRSDFFEFSHWQSSLGKTKPVFDIIVGNAPWGKKTATDVARQWANGTGWRISNNDTGPLFLPACESLLKPKGRLSMLQPAMTLLFNRSGPAADFRERLFASYNVEQVVNFSPVRFILFGGQSKAVSPACLVVMKQGVVLSNNDTCEERFIQFATVKPRHTSEDNCVLSIDAFDIHSIRQTEAAHDPTVWTCLSWGGRRDFALLKQLSSYESLNDLKTQKKIRIREGINRGDRKKEQPTALLNRPILETSDFPENSFPLLKIDELPINTNLETDSRASTDFSAFNYPQLLIKAGWTKKESRFKASIVAGRNTYSQSSQLSGALCSQSYISVHVPHNDLPNSEDLLTGAMLMLNSKLAVYLLLLSSSRFASYRPEPTNAEILSLPIPAVPRQLNLATVNSPEKADAIVRKAIGISDTEWTLVEDLFDYTLPDFKQGANSPGRSSLTRKTEPELRAYAKYFYRVIQDTFGKDKRVSCTVWQEKDTTQKLGFRFVSLTLDTPENEPIFSIQRDTNSTLLERVSEVIRDQKDRYVPIPILSTMRFYSTVTDGKKSYPTIWLIKPDQVRYWTRSMGMRDADEVVADIMYAGNLFDGAT